MRRQGHSESRTGKSIDPRLVNSLWPRRDRYVAGDDRKLANGEAFFMAFPKLNCIAEFADRMRNLPQIGAT